MTPPRARIAGVQAGVQQPVEGHGGRAGADHRHHNPGDLPGQSGGGEAILADGQQASGQREGEGEDGVLEPDHVQRQPQFLQEALCHGNQTLF